MQHQYISRETGQIVTEQLIGDHSIDLLYNRVREQAPGLFRALTSQRMSAVLGFLHFDINLPVIGSKGLKLLRRMKVDCCECLAPYQSFSTPRQVFERQIRYWECRPMDQDPSVVVSPADAKVLIGSLDDVPELFIKEKFFSAEELLGPASRWRSRFSGGSFAIFRLTPDKYHYNHVPVSGEVVDLYTVEGDCHSCNPKAQIALASIHAKNRRVVTMINTDIPGGSGIGLVAMVEVVALMIGDIHQCYSQHRYDNPKPLTKGMFLAKGCPKSLYRPGSSTDILLFQKEKIIFAKDLRNNAVRSDVSSRFSVGLGRPLVETDLRVRSTVALRNQPAPPFSPLTEGV
ncbi:MAG: phosphatidylserine decarboxylase [Desulfobulbus sp.]|nr:phosphatidylserine decarboxylase [Desulfobulbus sp.]